jgi:hypothetical protein
MKKRFLGNIFLLLFLCVSCTVDRDDENVLLGSWIETAPEADRTELYFAPGNRLTLVDGDGLVEEYIYTIDENTLALRSINGSKGTTELFFEQINLRKIKVENLYPGIPEAAPTFMIFEKR